jgi:hypothetical protein
MAYRRYIGFCFRSFEVILFATDVGRLSALRPDDGLLFPYRIVEELPTPRQGSLDHLSMRREM